MGAIALCVALGGLIGWLVGRQGDASPIKLSANPLPVVALQPAPMVTNVPTAPAALAVKSEMSQAPASTQPQGWEEKLEQVLLADENENAKADHLLQLMQTAPAEAQVELAQHLCNMVQDSHYDGAASILTNAATPVDVSTVLLNDLLNRGNNLKLPMLLAVARSDDHPLRGQARDMLELFVQNDYGTNWDQWSTAVDSWLQQQAQQQPADAQQ